MSLTENCIKLLADHIGLPVSIYVVWASAGSLHPADSRMLCLPQKEEMRTDIRRIKGSLV